MKEPPKTPSVRIPRDIQEKINEARAKEALAKAAKKPEEDNGNPGIELTPRRSSSRDRDFDRSI